MRFIDRLHAETSRFHADADEDLFRLYGAVTPRDYARYLKRCYGYTAPVERSVVATDGIHEHLDLRRFNKHELLRCDLEAFRMTRTEIEQLPQCTVPLFDSPEEALGWAYVIERATLGHSNLFRHLATVIPGEVAYSSSYLKCYVGAIGDVWRAYACALDSLLDKSRAVAAARSAFRTIRAWRHRLYGIPSASDSGGHRFG